MYLFICFIIYGIAYNILRKLIAMKAIKKLKGNKFTSILRFSYLYTFHQTDKDLFVFFNPSIYKFRFDCCPFSFNI